MVDTTQSTLLERMAAGIDPVTWRDFHRRYAGLLSGFARHEGLLPSECDDVVQEVLLTLLRSMRDFRYDPKKGRFRGFLKTLTARAIHRHRGKKLRHSSLDRGEARLPGADEAEVDARWEDEWRRHHLRRAMHSIRSEFSEANRQAFALHVVSGLSAGATAAKVGISVDQVYQAKSRILRRLRSAVASQIAAEDRQ